MTHSLVPVLENRCPGSNRQTFLKEFMIVKAAHFQNDEVDRIFASSQLYPVEQCNPNKGNFTEKKSPEAP